jgi:hypothetical protein
MQGAAVLSCPCEMTWVRFPLLSSPLDGMGFDIVAVLSPSATNLATVAGAATLVDPEQPREKSSILPRREVCRFPATAVPTIFTAEQPWLVKGKVPTAAPCILSVSTMEECD